jgi:glucosamine--fructose-6-phosphate aminotransferase (isomerizing)
VQPDLAQQPQVLHDLAAFYEHGDGAVRLASLHSRPAPILTGMGASLHAAQALAPYFHSLDIPAIAVEATDLFFYSQALLRGGAPLVFVSQSGASVEVAALAELLPESTTLIAVTNDPHSRLAQHAHVVLPTLAGTEGGLATKTYVASLAVLWLLARGWAGAPNGAPALLPIAEACAGLLADGEATAARWLDALGAAETIVFLGHGPQAATARQAAMMLAERARAAALGGSIGAFRHGPIELAQPGIGIVLLAGSGRARESALALADELCGYGAQVLLVAHGRTSEREIADEPEQSDEFLAPILDIIPVQLFAEALANQRAIAPAFRYISKVATQL